MIESFVICQFPLCLEFLSFFYQSKPPRTVHLSPVVWFGSLCTNPNGGTGVPATTDARADVVGLMALVYSTAHGEDPALDHCYSQKDEATMAAETKIEFQAGEGCFAKVDFYLRFS